MSEPMIWHDESEGLEVWGTLDPPDACMCRDCVLGPDVRREKPITRTLCLMLSGDLTLPLQCKFDRDHSGDHEWAIERSGVTEYRAQLLRDEQDTPSGVLLRRVPGEALREATEAAVSEFESEGGTSGPGEAARPGASAFQREVMETWTA